MGNWVENRRKRRLEPIASTSRDYLFAQNVSRAPNRRRKSVKPGPFILYLLVLVAIVSYWYAVFSKTELLTSAPVAEDKSKTGLPVTQPIKASAKDDKPKGPELTEIQKRLIAVARAQLEAKVRHTERYYRLNYPGGDVPADVGLNVDLVIRMLRAVGVDLQKRIHEDILRDPDAYPLYRWANHNPDPNIDHRRLANVQVYLSRYAHRLTNNPAKTAEWQPGDIVVWTTRARGQVPNHIGVVGARRSATGVPYAYEIHHLDGRISNHRLINHWAIRGHYRWESWGSDLRVRPPGSKK
ncbi:MAG: DUF1287 domain-containing protein [Myxococcales bacterium]|nr:DUF1287 domain-containing protein [Myxococcales bacterium]